MDDEIFIPVGIEFSQWDYNYRHCGYQLTRDRQTKGAQIKCAKDSTLELFSPFLNADGKWVIQYQKFIRNTRAKGESYQPTTGYFIDVYASFNREDALIGCHKSALKRFFNYIKPQPKNIEVFSPEEE